MKEKHLDRSHASRDLMLAAVSFGVAFVLWQMQDLSFITYPFRLFVTMIHELGHGLAAILTGGNFIRFEVTRYGAGLAYTSQGSRFFVIQAGYLGTAIFGAVLLVLTHRVRRTGYVAIGVGLLIGVLTLLYSGLSFYHMTLFETVIAVGVLLGGAAILLVVDMDTRRENALIGLGLMGLGGLLLLAFAGGDNLLTIVVGLASAVILVVLGLFGSRDLVVVTLTFLAFLTGLQAITDAWILLRILSLPMVPNNDAVSMARDIGGSATVWALTWMAMDVVIFGTAAYFTLIRPWREHHNA